jgi:hypothetical protein
MKDDNSREDFSIPTWLKWTLPSLSALAAIIEIAIYVREHTTLVLTLLAGVVYTLICFVLIYVLCSIEEIGGNIQGADSKTIWQYPLSWRVGAAIVLVLIVGCHSLHYSGYIGFEDRVKADSFRILVANLDAPRNEGYGITASILNQLRGETDTLTKVQVEALEDTITVG